MIFNSHFTAELSSKRLIDFLKTVSIRTRPQELPTLSSHSSQPITHFLSMCSYGIMYGLKTETQDQVLTSACTMPKLPQIHTFPIALFFNTFQYLAYYVILLTCPVYCLPSQELKLREEFLLFCALLYPQQPEQCGHSRCSTEIC